MRLLIIDDEPGVLRCLERVLARHYDVTTTSSATAARILIAKRHYDAILCDVNMPGVKGTDFVGNLPPERAARVVLMSGDAEAASGPVLPKPLVQRELLDTLDAIAAR